MHILLVDDEIEFIETLAERLEMRGYEVDYATTPLDAMDRVTGRAYSLVVLDMKLPGTSGLQLQHELNVLRPGMQYIFLTGHGSETDYQQARSKAAHYLIKPVNIDILIAKINETIGRHGKNTR